MGEKERIMSNDPNEIDATDPTQLLGIVDCVENSITAARLGGPPPEGMVAGMCPVGIATADQVCAPEDSVLGAQFVQDLGPAANLPPLRNDMAATFGGCEPLTPDAPKYDTPEFSQ